MLFETDFLEEPEMSVTLIVLNPKFRRVAALLLCVLLALSLLLSAAFVLAERHHHCTGEHCAICAAVAQTVSFLKAEASAFLSNVTVLVPLFALFVLFAGLHPADLPKQSPVSLKVKLSD
jgi:hypothetical protein